MLIETSILIFNPHYEGWNFIFFQKEPVKKFRAKSERSTGPKLCVLTWNDPYKNHQECKSGFFRTFSHLTIINRVKYIRKTIQNYTFAHVEYYQKSESVPRMKHYGNKNLRIERFCRKMNVFFLFFSILNMIF